MQELGAHLLIWVMSKVSSLPKKGLSMLWKLRKCPNVVSRKPREETILPYIEITLDALCTVWTLTLPIGHVSLLPLTTRRRRPKSKLQIRYAFCALI